MPAVIVPELKRKFALLRAYSKRKTWPDLAKAFNRSVKTLELWQNGGGSRKPDRMPEWAVPILTGLICGIVPGERSAEDLKALVFGPAAILEAEARTGVGSSMMRLIAREAQAADSSLIRKPDGIELVEVETPVIATSPRLRLGEWFRIAFRRRRQHGYVLAMQHTQDLWAIVPNGQSTAEPQTVFVPGLDGSGEPAFMRERRDPGRHLFICLETPDPPPAHVMAHGGDEAILGKRALDALAAFFNDQDADKRRCHLLEVEIEPAPG